MISSKSRSIPTISRMWSARACDKRDRLVLENRGLENAAGRERRSGKQTDRGQSRPCRRYASRSCISRRTDAAVLITGETGTGKEVIAQALHDFSHPGRSGPFMAINAAALPEAMVEAELFGHEAGAFTGADRQRTGRIEAARRWCVCSWTRSCRCHSPCSPNCCRVLQEKKDRPDWRHKTCRSRYPPDQCGQYRAGGSGPVRDDLREDLLFRLNTIELRVPPLRERGPRCAAFV